MTEEFARGTDATVFSSLDFTPIDTTPEANEELNEIMTAPTATQSQKRKERRIDATEETTKKRKTTSRHAGFFRSREDAPEEGSSDLIHSRVLSLSASWDSSSN